jgi:cytochrome c nitrite reductase small subunit
MLAAVVAVGVLVGFSLFTFDYAEGMSYFSSDPSACVNCHIMRDQFDGWNHSSHKAVAGCNDCHAPHTFPDKWIVKGINGFNHSVAFTFDNFHEPIQIRPMNERVALENCVGCHETATSQIHVNSAGEEISCISCHQEVGHSD